MDLETDRDERPSSPSAEEFIAALTIQNEYRAYLGRKVQLRRQNDAAKTIQTKYREHLRLKQRNSSSNLTPTTAEQIVSRRSSSLSIPGEDPTFPETRIVVIEPTSEEDTETEVEKMAAAITIQRHYRRHHRRQRAAVTIQRKFRDHRRNIVMERNKMRETRAASTIQKQYRKHQTRKRDAAARQIQSHYRREEAARKIQVRFRKHLADRQQAAAVHIQKQFRKYREGKKRDRAARLIQTQFRNYRERASKTPLRSDVLESPLRSITPNYTPIEPPSLHFDSLVIEDSSPPPKPARSRATSYNKTGPSTQPASTPVSASSWYSDDSQFNTGTVHVQFGKTSKIPVRTKAIKGTTSPQKRTNKISPSRKSLVQQSIDAKRVERKTEKNSKKDRYHLFGIKHGSQQQSTPDAPSPVIAQPRPPKIEKKSRGKKSDTPLVTQEPPKTTGTTETEPELIILRESSEETIYKDNATVENSYLRSSVESVNNNLNCNRNDNTTQIPFATKVPLGTLDSYVVQGMLRKNELVSRQAADTSSYLKSYIRQMEKRPQIKKVPKRSPRRQSDANRTIQSGYSAKTAVQLPDVTNLQKIAHFGRNSNPKDFNQLRAVLEAQNQNGVYRRYGN